MGAGVLVIAVVGLFNAGAAICLSPNRHGYRGSCTVVRELITLLHNMVFRAGQLDDNSLMLLRFVLIIIVREHD
jgi:hypothetical protein